MSYDLYALPIGEDDDPHDALLRAMDAADEEDPKRWTAEAKARAEAVAAALLALNPQLERFPFDYAEIAKFENTTEDEARVRNQHIELNGPEGGSPVQIEIQAEHASVSVPYWSTGNDSREKVGEMLTYLAAIEAQTGWRSYDPQMGRSLDVITDLDAIAAMYAVGTDATQGDDEENDPPADGEPRRKKRFGLF